MATYYYLRVSTNEQNADNQYQVLAARFATPDAYFTDSGVSGTKPALERPDFKRMFDLLQPGDTVIVTAIDRLGRDSKDVIGLVELLNEMGITLISHREGVDFSTPTGECVLTMLVAVAKLERAYISERTKQGLAATKARGTKLGKRFSQSIDRAGIVADLEAGITMRSIAAKYGVSLGTVANIKKGK